MLSSNMLNGQACLCMPNIIQTTVWGSEVTTHPTTFKHHLPVEIINLMVECCTDMHAAQQPT
jgi:hypothetical protein